MRILTYDYTSSLSHYNYLDSHFYTGRLWFAIYSRANFHPNHHSRAYCHPTGYLNLAGHPNCRTGSDS